MNCFPIGLDNTVIHMNTGDRYLIQFSGENSFEKPKASQPGKPRIPAGASLEYEVELIDIPGRGDAEENILDAE